MIGKPPNSARCGYREKYSLVIVPTTWERCAKYVISPLPHDIEPWEMLKQPSSFFRNFLRTIKINICKRAWAEILNIGCQPIFLWLNSKDCQNLPESTFSGIKKGKLSM